MLQRMFDAFYNWLARGTPWDQGTSPLVLGVVSPHPASKEEYQRLKDALPQAAPTLVLVTLESALAEPIQELGYSVRVVSSPELVQLSQLILTVGDQPMAIDICKAAASRGLTVWTAPPIIAS